MDKLQVTVAVQAVGLKGPLGSIRLAVSAGVEDGQHYAVLLVQSEGQLREVRRLYAPYGPLTHSTAQLWSAELDDIFYGYLARVLGIQGQLEDLPG